MYFDRLMRIIETKYGLKVIKSRKGLTKSEETAETLECVY